jgi:hypothetical protein
METGIGTVKKRTTHTKSGTGDMEDFKLKKK